MNSLPIDMNKLTVNLLDRMNKYVSKYSIKQWDLGATASTDSSVQVDHGIAKQLKGSQRSSVTIRVWNNQGLVGITSTSDLSDAGLQKSVHGAYEASLFGNPNESPQFSELCKAPLPKLERPLKKLLGIQNILEILIEAESSLLSTHKSISSVPYNGISESNYQRIYINSEGANRSLNNTQASLYLYARAEELRKKPRSSGSVRLALGVEDLDIDGCILEASKRTISHLNYIPIRTDKYLVCFTPEAILELISSFSSMFNARAVIDGVSLSERDSIGKKISSPIFSLCDNALHPSNIGATSFDGEGTPTQNITIIESGRIKNFLHSEATARSFGVKPTGHAGMGAKASVSPDWFEIGRSKEHKNKTNNLNHRNSNEEFVLIESLNALHSGVKASQGSFSLPFDGWLVRNGETISIEAATVAGDIIQVLNNIVEIEMDSIVTHSGISPHVWVDGLSITGEA